MSTRELDEEKFWECPQALRHQRYQHVELTVAEDQSVCVLSAVASGQAMRYFI